MVFVKFRETERERQGRGEEKVAGEEERRGQGKNYSHISNETENERTLTWVFLTEHPHFTKPFIEFHHAFKAYVIFTHFSLIQYLGTFLVHYYN